MKGERKRAGREGGRKEGREGGGMGSDRVCVRERERGK